MYLLLVIESDVEPCLRATLYESFAACVKAARLYRKRYGSEDGLFWVQRRAGHPSLRVGSFAGEVFA